MSELKALYQGSIAKWVKILEKFESGESMDIIFYDFIMTRCSFCLDVSKRAVDCDGCLINKSICDKEASAGLICEFRNFNISIDDTPEAFRELIVQMINALKKELEAI